MTASRPSRRALIGGLAALAAARALPAAAQGAGAFPGRGLRIVVPFAAGTGSDVVARSIGQKLAEQLGQPVVAENREGAGGVVGTNAVRQAPADGYTLLMAANPFTIAPATFATAPYDPLREFVPVAKVADVPIVLTVAANSPFQTLRDVVAFSKANPGKLTYASSGKGTPSQFETELIKQAAGIDMLEVPYKNTAQALTDTMSGQVSMYPSAMPLALPHIRAGRARALAIIDRRRTQLLPDVPTVAEALQMPSFVSTPLWYGFVARAGTPPEAIARLESEIRRAAQTTEVRERLVGLGAQLVEIGNDEFAGQLRAEFEKATRLARELGIRND
jgi:tripartite-type tricarboxylate transporter receptor subunit TctC